MTRRRFLLPARQHRACPSTAAGAVLLLAGSAAAVATSVGVAGPAAADPPGWLDRTYAVQGMATITQTAGPGAVRPGSAVDPSGRTLVLTSSASGATVSRLTAAGSLDTGYGTGGHVALTAPTAWTALAAGADGSAYVLADTADVGTHLVVARITAAGALDPGWGSGGVSDLAVGAAGPGSGTGGGAGSATGPALLAVRAGGGVEVAWRDGTDSLLAVLTSAGALDGAVTAAGPATGVVLLPATIVRGLAVDGARTVLSGTDGDGLTAQLRRLGATGAADGTFATAGAADLPAALGTPGAVLVASGGDYLVGGARTSDTDPSLARLTVARLTSAGAAAAFGDAGVATAPGWTCADAPAALAADTSAVYTASTCPTFSPDLARLSPAGVLDSGFGGGGHVTLSDLGDLFVDRLTGLGLAAGQLVVGAVGSLPGSGSPSAVGVARLRATSAVVPGGFVPIAPVRLLDTRIGLGAPTGAVAPHATVTLTVGGRGGVPLTDAAAAVLNVTVTGPTAPGVITVYPADAALPTASNVNFGPGQTVPNLVTTRLSSGGQVKLLNNSSGTVHLVADVSGYYRAGSPVSAGTFTALPAPVRLLDTRIGNGAARAAVGPQGVVVLQVDGRGGVPASNVSAVVLNVTVTGPTGTGFITAYPTGATRPGASSLNFVPGRTVPNLVTVRVGSGGTVSLANVSTGAVHLVADVAGWYRGGVATAPGAFVPLTPLRVLDTRVDRTPANTLTPVPAGGSRSFYLLGAPAYLPVGEVGAVVLNVTVTGAARPGFVSAIPGDQQVVESSNVNYAAGQTVANQVDVGTGYGGVIVYNSSSGSVQVIADLAGWFRA